MELKSDLANTAHNVATHPAIGKAIAQGGAAVGAAGTGFSAYIGYFEKGVGLAAALMGLLVTVALWRKLRLERREIELRVQDMERRLHDLTPDD